MHRSIGGRGGKLDRCAVPDMTASDTRPAQPLRDRLRDDLVAGLTHALSNRVATISAAAHWLGSASGEARQVAVMLAEETAKLEDIVHLLRLLPENERAPAEPIHVPEMLAETAALFRHHRALRGRRCVVQAASDVQPVWAPRAALRQALLLALAATEQGAGQEVTIGCAGTDAVVVLSIGPADPDASAADTIAVRDAMRATGGDALDGDASRYELRLPTLLEIRRGARDRG